MPSMPLLLVIGMTTSANPELFPDQDESDLRRVLQHSDTINDTTSLLADAADSQSAVNNRTASFKQFFLQYWTLCIQHVLGLQILGWVFISQTSLIQPNSLNYTLVSTTVLAISLLSIAMLWIVDISANIKAATTFNLWNSILAFTVSVTWIYLIATTAVTGLKTIGLVLNIPNAILGATVFAVGNSSNDLVANPAVTRRGYPILAASACFGGPMLNMLLGIGIGGLMQVLKGKQRRYSFELSPSLFVSSATLMAALCVVLTYAFYNSWRLDKRLGGILIGMWCVSTACNVIIDLV